MTLHGIKECVMVQR